MSVITRFIGRLFGGNDKPAGKPVRPHVPAHHQRNAKYEASLTGPENQQHWKDTDYLSANAANSAAVRSVLRVRSRYERANNGYFKGLVRARTNDTIGTGPRLQLDFPDEVYDEDFQTTMPVGDPGPPPQSAADLARLVERKWYEWCEENNLTDKLRILADAEDVDGEAFGLLISRNTDFPVKLGLRAIECDRVMTPDLYTETATELDGIQLNADGEPIAYTVLRNHPGSQLGFLSAAGIWDYDTYPARQIIHLFDADRPEQARGIPLLTPALPLYSILRRYTLASLGAAELGAMISGIITNENLSPDSSGDDAPLFEAMDEIPFSRNALLTLAAGQKAEAFESKNPSPSYKEFKSEVLTEAGRSAGENRNTATGSSAEYNYSSGRLDHLPRQRGIEIRRDRWERACLDRLFRAWLDEAILIADYLPAGLPDFEEWEWCWQWDGFPSIDPFKDANAQKVRKEIGLTTDAAELAKEGIDWREHYKQLAREKAMREELGIEPQPKPAAPALGMNPDGTDPTDQTDPADQGVPADG